MDDGEEPSNDETHSEIQLFCDCLRDSSSTDWLLHSMCNNVFTLRSLFFLPGLLPNHVRTGMSLPMPFAVRSVLRVSMPRNELRLSRMGLETLQVGRRRLLLRSAY